MMSKHKKRLSFFHEDLIQRLHFALNYIEMICDSSFVQYKSCLKLGVPPCVSPLLRYYYKSRLDASLYRSTFTFMPSIKFFTVFASTSTGLASPNYNLRNTNSERKYAKYATT